MNQASNNIHTAGGTAGNALANRLTENPLFNVLVLEAGPLYVCTFAMIAKILCLSNEGMKVYWILLFSSLPKKLSYSCPETETT